MFSGFHRIVGVAAASNGRIGAAATAQCRDFCAWRPEWQRKKPSPKKVAEAKERLRKSSIRKKQIDVASQMKKMKEAERKYKELVTFEPPKPDNVVGQNVLAQMKMFHATDSPFVYLLHPPEDIYEPDQYWNHDAVYQRTKAKFFYLSPAAFNHELPTGTRQGEVAFLGRSNVGKSSLMNALMQEKLARTSKAPGRTQQVGYYGMFMPPAHRKHDDYKKATGFVVDLPGYGYARGPDDAVDAWQKNTQTYLLDRMETGTLRRLYVLVDSRRPQQDMDWNIFTWLDTVGHAIPYSVVLTKADSITDPASLTPHLNSLAMRFQHKTQDRIEKNEQILGGQSPVIHVTSATKNMGLNELWKSLAWELGPTSRENPFEDNNNDNKSADLEDYDEEEEEEGEYNDKKRMWVPGKEAVR